MRIKNRIAETHNQFAAWRGDFYEHPQLMREMNGTAQIVTTNLREFGYGRVADLPRRLPPRGGSNRNVTSSAFAPT